MGLGRSPYSSNTTLNHPPTATTLVAYLKSEKYMMNPMIQALIPTVKPMIANLIREKCLEKIATGSKTFNISLNELESLLLEHLGVDFLSADFDTNNAEIILHIDEDALHGK